jgi:hypothetical protein
MEWFVKAFLKSSVSWLAAGVTLGVAMGVHPAWSIYRTAHLHMLLLGFVAMMIFGVAYHVIPRFAGSPLRSTRAAGVHWWILCPSGPGPRDFQRMAWRWRQHGGRRRLHLRVSDLEDGRRPAPEARRSISPDDVSRRF